MDRSNGLQVADTELLLPSAWKLGSRSSQRIDYYLGLKSQVKQYVCA